MSFERTLVILKPDARAPRNPESPGRVFENAGIAEGIFKELGLKTVGTMAISRAGSAEHATLKEGELPVERFAPAIGEANAQKITLGPENLRKLFDAFYIEHLFSERNNTVSNYYPQLGELMSSGTSVVMVLEGENAVAAVREKLGHWNSKNWKPGDVRHAIGDPDSATNNGIHASDSVDAARREIGFFQKTLKLAVPPEPLVSNPEIAGNSQAAELKRA